MIFTLMAKYKVTDKIILAICLLLVCGCSPNKKNEGEHQKDSLGIESGEVNTEEVNAKIEESKIDTSAIVRFGDYRKEGLLLPEEYKKYDKNIKVIGQLKVGSIQKIAIIQKSLRKHAELTNQEFCD